MKVHEIVETYLKDNGYDGLTTCDECGCEVGDLAPCCADDFWDCEPGHKVKGDEYVDFYIVPGKRP
jgi:hypothetical protein